MNERFIVQYSRLVVSALLSALVSPAPPPGSPPSGMSYLDNGVVKVGVNLTLGAISTFRNRVATRT